MMMMTTTELRPGGFHSPVQLLSTFDLASVCRGLFPFERLEVDPQDAVVVVLSREGTVPEDFRLGSRGSRLVVVAAGLVHWKLITGASVTVTGAAGANSTDRLSLFNGIPLLAAFRGMIIVLLLLMLLGLLMVEKVLLLFLD